MTPQLNHPLLPRKMALGGLPWVVVLIRPVLDALFAAKKADATSLNPLLRAHQPTVGLLFWKAPLPFLAHDAQVAAQRAESASFAVALAIKPVAHHAAIL